MTKYKRTFEIYDEDGNLLIRKENTYPDSGRQHALEEQYMGITWQESPDRYFGIGRSTDTNAGVEGPSGSVEVSVSGSWQGGSQHDWKLSDEITGSTAGKRRVHAVPKRAGNSVVFWGEISELNWDNNKEETVREIGLFLTGDFGTPSNDPTSTSATSEDKAGAMISRAVYTFIDGVNFVDDGLTLEVGSKKKIRYIIDEYEG